MNKIKHLEFIEEIIKRLNLNSFLLKGWCITIISALFIFSGNSSNTDLDLFSIIPCIAFWILDGFFIKTERKYKELYKNVAKKEEKDINFSLEIDDFSACRNTWLAGIFSKTLLPFYGIIIAGIFIFYYFK